VPNALVEFAEQPMMGGRQNDNIAPVPDKLCRGFDLITIVMNVLKNIHVQNAIEG
jgi:hypothetical protein